MFKIQKSIHFLHLQLNISVKSVYNIAEGHFCHVTNSQTYV